MYNIAIIGCGVIGLTAAAAIQEEYKSGVKITIFADKLTPNTTSDVAAGLWGPFYLQDTKLEKIQEWGKGAHDYFLHLWKSGFAAEAGVTLQLVKSVTATDISTLDHPHIVFGMQELPPDQIQELSIQHDKAYKSGCTFVTFTCEPRMLLPFLQKRFLANGGTIKNVKIKCFDELSDFDLIVNCPGLMASEIASDSNMTPIRGQVARVYAPWQFHSILNDGNYVVGNCNSIVLGGTNQMGDTDTNPRDSDIDRILNGSYDFIPALRNAPILYHSVGLRPGRTRLRLEKEVKNINGKNITIVHNYGHGGGGVSLSYGCALETLQLVREALADIPHRSKL
ncbi:hypothetical protein RN001_015917 [Aquatica leii]|uniref:FAD dependent oxidoreductase domain-containing protein n=1 Tax=Aquatica leii TaxID=1421715 RepID=A0AAN7NZL8_9COLE|nr:hypothetical protein RN001_015917 [Aquatica leii]